MKDELKKIAQMAELDQAAAGLANMARLLAAFYNELVVNGVPPDVAADLTGDYFETLRKGLFPDART